MLVYQDAAFSDRHNVRLDDQTYEQAMRAFVIVCVDVVLTDASRTHVYLADRIVEPFAGWWWMGGRVLRGEMVEVAAVRKLKQETGLIITQDRLRYVETVRYLSHIRQQKPREAGSDTIGFTYALEAEPDELGTVAAHLDKDEFRYHSLRGFTRKELESSVFRKQVKGVCNLILA